MSTKKDEKTMELKEIVPEYNSSVPFIKKLYFDRIKYAVKLAKITDDKIILDVGCGIGHLAREIRKINKKCRVVGIDFNINVKNISIEGCEFKVEDVKDLSFGDNSFDVVFALSTLEHIKEVEQAINQIKRVLKPDGVFMLSGPTESFFYKLCRFLIKGTFSEKEGPGTGVHYHTINTLDKKIQKYSFLKKAQVNLPKNLVFILQKVIKYSNRK